MREIIVSELKPGPDQRDRSDLEADLRRRLMLIYHPVGTCRMSDEGEDAVVDSRASRPWSREPARRGRVGHARHPRREHQRADDHDRRARGGPDPRTRVSVAATATSTGPARAAGGGGRARPCADRRGRAADLLDGRDAARARSSRCGRLPGDGRGGRRRAPPRQRAAGPGRSTRVGHESERRDGPAPRRHRARADADEQDQGGQRRGARRDLRAGRPHDRVGAGGGREGPPVPPRPGQPDRRDRRRERRGVLGRPARAEVRGHARLRARRRGGAADGRDHPQRRAAREGRRRL